MSEEGGTEDWDTILPEDKLEWIESRCARRVRRSHNDPPETMSGGRDRNVS